MVPRNAVDADTGMILRTEKSVLFFIPWGQHWIVGTTDTDFAGDRAEPAPTEEDIEYILAAANRVLARPLTRADAALARPLAEGHPYLRAEVAYAVTHENALHVEDVLMRRTRLFIESADAGAVAAAEVSAIMGRLFGWSRRRRAAETRRYLDLVRAGQEVLAIDPGAVPDRPWPGEINLQGSRRRRCRPLAPRPVPPKIVTGGPGIGQNRDLRCSSWWGGQAGSLASSR